MEYIFWYSKIEVLLYWGRKLWNPDYYGKLSKGKFSWKIFQFSWKAGKFIQLFIGKGKFGKFPRDMESFKTFQYFWQNNKKSPIWINKYIESFITKIPKLVSFFHMKLLVSFKVYYYTYSAKLMPIFRSNAKIGSQIGFLILSGKPIRKAFR